MPTGLLSVVGILSVPNFWLAFCPDHLNMFWHFVTIMKITFHKKAKSIFKTGSDEGKLSQLLRTLCKEKEVDTMRWLFLLNVSDDAAQELVTEQIKSIVSEPQQIKGDSGLRAKLLLGKWAAAQELDTDTPMDCKECILKNSNFKITWF